MSFFVKLFGSCCGARSKSSSKDPSERTPLVEPTSEVNSLSPNLSVTHSQDLALERERRKANLLKLQHAVETDLASMPGNIAPPGSSIVSSPSFRSRSLSGSVSGRLSPSGSDEVGEQETLPKKSALRESFSSSQVGHVKTLLPPSSPSASTSGLGTGISSGTGRSSKKKKGLKTYKPGAGW
ncbi:hypothetical protein [Phaffia rhodozyma]|uniref:Uncharacterized protein n=1 Tax=Phaffia rhodozyma TaxID=264483 RepID=A0A0F7SFR4_PHARH|nr:hypothetical protein [Phaffia rhodozyma]